MNTLKDKEGRMLVGEEVVNNKGAGADDIIGEFFKYGKDWETAIYGPLHKKG